MKKLFVTSFLLLAFFTQAQESFFRGNNNYVMPVSFQAPAATTNGGVLRFSNGGFARTNSSFGRLATYTVEIWVKIALTIRFTSSQPMMAASV